MYRWCRLWGQYRRYGLLDLTQLPNNKGFEKKSLYIARDHIDLYSSSWDLEVLIFQSVEISPANNWNRKPRI